MAHQFVDAHFHLDLFPNPADMARDLAAAGNHVIAVTNAPSVFQATAALCSSSPNLHPAVGLHPELAVEYAAQLPMLWSALDRTRFVGEVGLDYTSGDEAGRQAQRRVFAEILEQCNRRGDRILSVHSRRAAGDVIAAVRGGFRGTIILHWFSGTQGELSRAAEAGCLFSVNTAMCQSQKGRALISRIDRSRVLTETDGPFIKVGSRPAWAPDLTAVLEALAGMWGCDRSEAEAQVLRNFESLTITE